MSFFSFLLAAITYQPPATESLPSLFDPLHTAGATLDPTLPLAPSSSTMSNSLKHRIPRSVHAAGVGGNGHKEGVSSPMCFLSEEFGYELQRCRHYCALLHNRAALTQTPASFNSMITFYSKRTCAGLCQADGNTN